MTVPWWYGAFMAAAGLLAVGGGLKLTRPAPTARALASVGLPSGQRAVRLGSAAEVAVAISAVWLSWSIFPALMAASYLAFAGFVLVARARRGTVSSCGCFGEADGAPTILHALLNVLAATVAAVAAVRPHPGLGRVLVARPAEAAALMGLVALCGYLAFLAMSVLPRTVPARGLGRAQ